MENIIISAEMEEGPHGAAAQEGNTPILAPVTAMGSAWQDSQGSFSTANNLQLWGKILMDQILHLFTVHRACIIPL